ncbi:Excalibur [uncultured Sphingopyxis sp.]|uniref:Excalibur n=1 Tax=uncultured Sphingopyxis sp. TaxID=310581 RepID=A0A1Y5PPF6_9SPHN|nr:thermonuclease family protein [uncultured Sphingopyxis sp.]SBV31861.1 Excalibur [uncultured Sphingopyxis sp.]
MRHIILAALMLGATPTTALAQEISGPARATDGDTLNMTGIVIRLHGIDAPELNQSCSLEGTGWACGRDAAARLATLVAGQSVRCEQRDTDDYGRIVATCRIGQIDLSAAMVDAGLAVALPHFSASYVANEARARERRVGIWGGTFQLPADYRAAHPSRPRRTPALPSARPLPSGPRPSAVYFGNCREARAAGAAPLYRGQPGYRPEMDGDGDGIACEPYRGR